MEIIHHIDLISSNPQVRQGRPCIAGTGITVADIVIATIMHHQTVDDIATDYDLSLAQVHAALAYYYAHKDDIDSDMKRRYQLAQDMKEKRVGSRHKPLFG